MLAVIAVDVKQIHFVQKFVCEAYAVHVILLAKCSQNVIVRQLHLFQIQN